MTTPSTGRSASPRAAASAATTLDARDGLVISLLLVSAFVVILNETLFGVAIPELIADLGVTAAMAQWLTTAFMLTLAVVIPITGFLLQRFQTRPMFIVAMSLFSLGTLLGALAPGFEMLLVARIVQASGTAIMMPLLFTTVFALVPPQIRGRIVGRISIVIAVAPALGPAVSGLILDSLGWRWLFIVMLPIALAALALGAVRVVNVGEPQPGRLDVLSVPLSAIGFGGFVYGLSLLGEAGQSGEAGSGEATTVAGAAIGIGLLGLALFVWRQLVLQRRGERALLDLRTFQARQFTLSILTVSIASMALFGAIILIPLYVQQVLDQSPLVSGLLILPGALLQGLIAPLIGRRYDAVGPRGLALSGAILLSVAMWGMTFLSATTPLWLITSAHIGLSMGLALLFTPLLTNGLSAIRPELNSYGSAIVGTIQQVSGAAGIALFISVAAAAGGAGSVASEVSAPGIQLAFTVGAIIATLAIPIVLLVRRVPQEEPPATTGQLAAQTPLLTETERAS